MADIAPGQRVLVRWPGETLTARVLRLQDDGRVTVALEGYGTYPDDVFTVPRLAVYTDAEQWELDLADGVAT